MQPPPPPAGPSSYHHHHSWLGCAAPAAARWPSLGRAAHWPPAAGEKARRSSAVHHDLTDRVLSSSPAAAASTGASDLFVEAEEVGEGSRAAPAGVVAGWDGGGRRISTLGGD